MSGYKRFVEYRQGDEIDKPEPGVFISGVRDDYALDIGRMNLTPARLGTYYRSADGGDTDRLFEVFNAVEEDPHVHSCLAKRKRHVLSRTFQIAPAIEENEQAQKAADIASQLIIGKDGIDGIENWDEALDSMSDAVARAFSLHQIIWDTSTRFPEPRQLQRVPHRECILGEPYKLGSDGRTDSDRVRVRTDMNRLEGEDLYPRTNWLLVINKARSDALAKSSLMRIVAWYWMFKHFSVRDWLQFCDRYGMPIRKATYPKNAGPDERNAVIAAVRSIGRDAWAALPEGANIELIEAAIRGEIPYPQLVEMANFEISKAILGGTLTTESGDRGARSLGEVHERNERMIANSDARKLAGAIRRDLIKPIVLFHLGANYPIPKCEFLTDEEEDLKARAERDKILSKDIGLPMSKAYFYETYQVTPPADDEDLVNPSAAAATDQTVDEAQQDGAGEQEPPAPPSNGETEPTEEEMEQVANAASMAGFDPKLARALAQTKLGRAIIANGRGRWLS